MTQTNEKAHWTARVSEEWGTCARCCGLIPPETDPLWAAADRFHAEDWDGDCRGGSVDNWSLCRIYRAAGEAE